MKDLAAVAAISLLSGLFLMLPDAQAESDLSPEAAEMVQLYQELHAFKDKNEFHQVGFGVCCEYNEWIEKVDDLTQRAGIEMIREFGILPAELRRLGLEYLTNKGKPNASTKLWEANIKPRLGN